MITVVCVLVRGHVAFTPEYVTRLKSMVRRTLPSAGFVCLTDDPASLPKDIDTIRIIPPRGVFAWWAKVQLFNPQLGLSGRLLYLDLDVLLVGDMVAITGYPAAFALVPDGAPNFLPKGARKVVKRFNSSVMVWNAGEHAHLYEDWNPRIADRLWGDQDWIGEQSKNGDAMPAEWFPRLSEVSVPWPSEARVVLCKKPKNAEAVKKWSWFNKEWQ